ncbi:MAG: hypothetical protein HQ567_32430 [Candidatus Nealsonbacteria bacterium]|nr:hypothetical protein [Candidatus Nealsonbacteria bacterium]
MISSSSHQPTGRSDNLGDYDRLFIPRVHRLIKIGYDQLTPGEHSNDEETAITGDLVEAIEDVLDFPTAKWMRFYSVHDDPPENQPRRRGRQRRRGRKRKRVDIRFVSSKTSPRTRFRFECKRLGRGHNVGLYLGAKGLGCFLTGDYAREDTRAGMLGYVQSDDEETWAGKLEQRLLDSPRIYSLRAESPWRHEPVIREFAHTYRSDHGRGRGRRPIEIYHTLLRFY